MKKSENGVTLIALVVTIVVLLILAGTAIAMLSGDDGIMTNAQRSQAANTEGEISYNASSDAEMKNLFKIAANEIGITPTSDTQGFDEGLTILLNTSTKQIYFQYNDNKFGGSVDDAASAMEHATINNSTNIDKLGNGTQKIKQNDGTNDYLKPIRADIVLTTDNATLTMDPAQVL